MKPQGRARRIGACLTFGFAYATAVFEAGAQWETVPEITLEAETNDNPALEFGATGPIAVEDASRLLADVTVRFSKVEPRGELMFQPRVSRDVYADEEARDLESTDAFFRSSGEYRGQTVRVGYTSDLARERLLGVDFLETVDVAADDPSAIATNQVGANERRTRLGIAPYVDVSLSTRGGIRLDGRIVDVDYTRGATGGRTDFVEQSLGGQYWRALGDERGRFAVGVFATGYEASLNNNQTDTRGLELSYTRTVTELWSWSISGGAQRSDFVLSSAGRRVRGSDNAAIFGIGVNKRGEQSSMRAEFAREMSPDALGFVAPRDEIRVSWRRALSERMNGFLGLRAIDAEGRPEVVASGRSYGVLELDMEWQFNPQWWFIAGYAHSTARTSGAGSSANSNSLALGVRYRGRSAQSPTRTPAQPRPRSSGQQPATPGTSPPPAR